MLRYSPGRHYLEEVWILLRGGDLVAGHQAIGHMSSEGTEIPGSSLALFFLHLSHEVNS